jgi:hypothetical protein
MTNFLTALCKKFRPKPKGWTFEQSPGLDLLPPNNTFTFPQPPGSVHYLTREHLTPLAHKMRLICRITAPKGTIFDSRTAPASVRLFFLTKGGEGLWWSTSSIILADGQFELSVPIDHTQWSSVNKQSQDHFLNCCNNVDRVGMAFCDDNSFFGHGVHTTSGIATFEIVEFIAL